MENVPDTLFDEQPIAYGGFWRRAAALFLDGILMLAVLYPFNWYDLTHLKSYPLYLCAGLASALYKPLMEYKYGATLGKMAFGIKCINSNYQKLNIAEALNRNFIFLLSNIVTLVLHYFVFASPQFIEATDLREVGLAIHQFPAIRWTMNLLYLALFIDAIVLASDNRKRSLHDKWADTFVIYLPS